MDFSLSPEQRDICTTVEECARTRLNNAVFNDDETARFPVEKWRQCGDLGIMGLPVPEAYGGSGATMLTTALAVQALARTCTDEGLVFSLCAHLCTCTVPLMLFGTPWQKERWLKKCAYGVLIGGNGSSEAGAGSDLPSMTTSVTTTTNGYRLNGAKLFVTNGPVADLVVIYAKHPNGMRMADISAFLVENNTEGFATGQHFSKMGLRTSPLCEIVLTNCTVPTEHLLGRERFGMMVFNKSMLWERCIMAAYHIGTMEQQYTAAVTYARQRQQFGKNLIGHQHIAARLVAMQCNVETARLLLYKTCTDFDNGTATLAQSSLLKLHASESKVKNSLDAVQIAGAYGYIKESMPEKQLRDSIAATIYSGTSEIQKKIIADGISSHG